MGPKYNVNVLLFNMSDCSVFTPNMHLDGTKKLLFGSAALGFSLHRKENSLKMFSNAGPWDGNNLENVKSAVEHVGLYVGLVVFTAAGAKVSHFLYLF